MTLSTTGWSRPFLGRVALNGHPDQRLPNTLNVSVGGVIAAEVLAAATDLAASTASACLSGSHRPSDVDRAAGAITEAI